MGHAGGRVKVLYFTGGFSPHDRRFVRALVDAGVDVKFLSFFDAAVKESRHRLPEGVEILGGLSKSTMLRWITVPSLVRAVQSIVRRVEPDVIHAGPMHQGAFLTAMANAHPFVSMSWGSDLLAGARHGLSRMTARFTLTRSDAFLADCQAVRERAIELGMAAERIVTFPWGVDLKQFSPEGDGALRSQLDWQDAFVLVSTRAWEPLYGVDILVRAFLEALKMDESLRLLLLGGGSQKTTLERMIRDAGALQKVHLLARVDEAELPGYYRSADIYLSASHSDGSSVSLLEAMACGLPVLVSDIPGNREWVQQDVNGWLFPDGNVDALAEKILMLARSRARLSGAGARGRKLAEERADWQQNQARLFQAYGMAIDHARGKMA